MDRDEDPIAAFYERHPYPPPVVHLDALVARLGDGRVHRADHHLIWPDRPLASVGSVLVAGCGTAQAVRHALRRPTAHVVGIDLSARSLAESSRLAERHGVTNLDLHQLPIEDVATLAARFDHVVCTGVLHHLADPAAGLAALRSVLAPGGAITLMVYATYGRTGVDMLQEYCRRLGITPEDPELADLVDTLRELPSSHPLSPLLRESRDFLDDGALADALLNPRDRSYTVPELLDLLDGAGLRFGRWTQQAPYLPDCGSIGETPHAARIAALPAADQYAAVELFRGTLTRHSLVAFAADDAAPFRLEFDTPEASTWVPAPVPTTVVVEERLPKGAAAALLNRTHPATDLVLFVDHDELRTVRAIDGERPIGELGPAAASLVERLWRHDLVVIDATEDSR